MVMECLVTWSVLVEICRLILLDLFITMVLWQTRHWSSNTKYLINSKSTETLADQVTIKSTLSRPKKKKRKRKNSHWPCLIIVCCLCKFSGNAMYVKCFQLYKRTLQMTSFWIINAVAVHFVALPVFAEDQLMIIKYWQLNKMACLELITTRILTPCDGKLWSLPYPWKSWLLFQRGFASSFRVPFLKNHLTVPEGWKGLKDWQKVKKTSSTCDEKR